MLETDAAAVADRIADTIAEVMRERGLDPASIAPEARLTEGLGLKSMDLARIVLTLEDELEVDPFQTVPITSIRTVGDLTAAYLGALGLGGAPAPAAPDMAAEMQAARARRAGRRR